MISFYYAYDSREEAVTLSKEGRMDAVDIRDRARKDFNNAIAIMGVIPMLGFAYLLVGKAASLSALEGEAGYVMLILLALVLLGIVSARRILWYLITRIIDMQNELVEKGRLAAISETVISLSHEIRNPLAIVMGNLDLLSGKAAGQATLVVPRDNVHMLKENCDRICVVMDKMSRISKPSVTTVADNIKMIDLPACGLDERRGR
jgi:signal transduction histidine kinase